ncbi:MAG: phosphoribosylglycinamide formyltransferase, partial [Desulfobacterales bacterium]|nr:phosphoribosylglycinamide formyltransferase [Desulfobacterales bacterium]
MGKRQRIGVLVSGGGSNLQAIIDAGASNRMDGDVVFVGSDRPGIHGLERAARHHIPTFTVDYGEIIRRMRADPDAFSTPRDFDLEEVLSKQTLFSADVDAAVTAAFFKSRAAAEAALLEKMKSWPFDLLALAGFMRTLTPYFIDRVNTNPDLPRIMNIHPALLPAFPGVDGYGDAWRYGCKVAGCTVHLVDYGEDTGP